MCEAGNLEFGGGSRMRVVGGGIASLLCRVFWGFDGEVLGWGFVMELGD